MDHYKRAFENWSKVKAAKKVGCYYCCKVTDSKFVTDKCKDKNDYTAICDCGVDSVVPYDAEIDGTIAEFKLLLKKWKEESFTKRK